MHYGIIAYYLPVYIISEADEIIAEKWSVFDSDYSKKFLFANKNIYIDYA